MESQGYMLSPDSKLKFEVSTQINLLRDAVFVDLAFSLDGSLLAIAYTTCAHLYMHQPNLDNEYQEHWIPKISYRIPPNINGKITCMRWNGDDILVFGFDCGDVAMVLVSSQETILRGFDVSEYPITSIELDTASKFMAVVAGPKEVTFWEFMPVPGPWKALIMLPTLHSDLPVQIQSAHWVDGAGKPTLAVAYEQQGIVLWVMDFSRETGDPSDTIQVAFPITSGYFSPTGHLFLQPDELGGFQVYDIRASRAVKEFRTPERQPHTSYAKFLLGGEWLVGTGITIAQEYANLYSIDRIAESGIRRGNTLENFRIAAHFRSQTPAEPDDPVVVFKVFPRDDVPTAPSSLFHCIRRVGSGY
ncbi:hypothetical protein DFP72DRAFT_1065939 [Ephemerocybe angulata]|uniref:Uncharacterized protein n=1 Tax=Ephemerocybe angulata TaxID=980116 RepID=A0A8H6M9K0_9AGAR|nr:hypothetical protein DFP72DRAFT_1065939 [Tulosesus angulatus]